MLKYEGKKLTSLKGMSLTELMSLQKEFSILIGKLSFFREYGYFPQEPVTKVQFDIELYKALNKEEQQEIFTKLQYLYQLIDIIAVQSSNLARTFASADEALLLMSPPAVVDKKTA
ncbi:hypothetical protein [Anaerocellum danielii]|uniref:Uncharacterized protein n=1 Tax=Anaerocellum danielii TaxID=1387557 RepID=A0ABZ0TY39_9FIRM|nr:hypothetical protein [Caldicellulosiruptor danielii]WPX08122.1 hypothetical protein SOJ16_001986 [Caldicellulosiruptor danielii]